MGAARRLVWTIFANELSDSRSTLRGYSAAVSNLIPVGRFLIADRRAVAPTMTAQWTTLGCRHCGADVVVGLLPGRHFALFDAEPTATPSAFALVPPYHRSGTPTFAPTAVSSSGGYRLHWPMCSGVGPTDRGWALQDGPR